MKRIGRFAQVCLAAVVSVGSLWAQATAGTATPVEAPGSRLIQFSGVLKDHMGQPLSGVQGITFSLYKEQSGGAPLWIETQNVTADEQGRYSVLLGATTSDGLPLELFSSGEARWLGVQASLPGEEEQPRALLVSVPYALKAADAETLGGKPLSAFALAEAAATSADQNSSSSASNYQKQSQLFLSTAAVTGGTPGTLGKFDTDGLSLVNSVVIEGGGNLGIGTPTPGAKLDVKGSGTGNVLLGELGGVPPYGAIGLANSLAPGSYNFTSSADDANLYINRPTGKALKFRENNGADQMTILSDGNVGIGTATPGEKLEVAGNLKVSGSIINGSGSLSLPNTANATTGVLTLGGNPFLHNFGTNNMFLGQNAGNFTMTGTDNTAMGFAALGANTTGNFNTASGRNALYSNTSGFHNTASGRSALFSNTTGTDNTASGSFALSSNTTGSFNTASGRNALISNTSGFNNTASGYQAGYTATPANANTTGSNNTFIGYQSGPGVNGTTTPLTNATAIGTNAVVSASNALVLGSINGVNGATSSVNVGIGTTTPGAKLEVKGSATGNVLLGELGSVPTYGAIGLANSLAPGSYNFTSSADDANLYINRPTGRP